MEDRAHRGVFDQEAHSGQVWNPERIAQCHEQQGFDIWYLHWWNRGDAPHGYFGKIAGGELLNEGSRWKSTITEVGHLDSYLGNAAQEEPPT